MTVKHVGFHCYQIKREKNFDIKNFPPVLICVCQLNILTFIAIRYRETYTERKSNSIYHNFVQEQGNPPGLSSLETRVDFPVTVQSSPNENSL